MFTLAVLKEKKCRETYCSSFEVLKVKNVLLFEPPYSETLLMTPDIDSSGDDITIDLESKKCVIKLSDGFQLKGKLVRAD